jgi:hypothetical protein
VNIKLSISSLESKEKRVKDIFLEDDTEFIIGRKIGDLLINDAKGSKRHCSLAIINKKLTLTDLDSSNGTYIGPTRIRRAVALSSGSVFKVGSHRIQVHYKSDKPLKKLSVKHHAIKKPEFFNSLNIGTFIDEYVYTFNNFRSQPFIFLQDRGYDEELGKSLLYLSFNLLLIGASTTSIEGLLGAFGSFLFLILIAQFLSLTSFLSKIKGRFSEYVSFFSVFSILLLPISVCSNLPFVSDVARFIEVLVMIWGGYTFWRVFHFGIIRMFILQAIIIVSSIYLLSYFAPETYKDNVPVMNKTLLNSVTE